MDISIVSGTYNRLDSLARMVESVRRSTTSLIRYEIVLVDGGSVDGTIEWCKQQSDIHLIEHGQLYGAVKAFNDGAYASKGEYVILGNDDIEFLGESIFWAWLYMQNNPDCGIGCFYQDRERQALPDTDPGKWHVGLMPCIEFGKQTHKPYGQVCIVPRWLGDMVGWWLREEDYQIDYSGRPLKPLYTYGGDNEVSAKVYEMGYKVSPVPGTKIHDFEVMDDLRKINNITGGKDPKAMKGHHPDSWHWGRRWTQRVGNQLLTGPVIRYDPIVPNPIQRKERVVYLPIYEQGHPVQKEQKRGLREALAKVSLVAEFDYVTLEAEQGKKSMLAHLGELMQRIQPTLFLSQLHNGATISAEDVHSLKASWPQTRFVNWNGDFWPENLLSEDGLKLARVFDLQLTVNRDALDKYNAMGIAAEYWQIGYEPDGVGCEAGPDHDVVFLASGYSKARRNLVGRLRGLNLDFGLYGSGWPENWAKGNNLYNFKEACQCYRGAKISIGDSQWPETGFVSNRVFQALAAGGAALAHQWFRDMDKLGLVDRETCIIWHDFADLENRIRYYLGHENERKKIAEAGERLALERHSFDVRVQELFEMLQEEKQAVEVGWRW